MNKGILILTASRKRFCRDCFKTTQPLQDNQGPSLQPQAMEQQHIGSAQSINVFKIHLFSWAFSLT